MTKIYCADVSCAFCSAKGICTAKQVALGWVSALTVHDGRQEYNKCKTYERSQRTIEIEKFLANIQK